jgi:hypothetical protein
MGLGIAAVTYDSVEILDDFARRRHITVPLLADPRSEIIKRFRVLNPIYPAGHRARGASYPGYIVTDAEGIVRSKSFPIEEERRTADSILLVEGGAGNVVAGAAQRTPHFTVRTSATDSVVSPGQRMTLVFDFEMDAGKHAFAPPGGRGLRPLAVRFDPHPLVRFDAPRLPPSRTARFAALNESVAVYEGKFRILQDAVLALHRVVAPLLEQPDPKIVLNGRIEYQVCSERVCYPPDSVPVRWTLKVKKGDWERVPAPLQHRDGGP